MLLERGTSTLGNFGNVNTTVLSFRSWEYLNDIKYEFGSENIFIQLFSGLIVLVNTQILFGFIFWIY